VGIDSFDKAGNPFTRILLLQNAAVSTSGDTEQHLDALGTRYSHILDPHTGMGLVGAPAVTVIARRGLDADPAATCISVLGPVKGMNYANQHASIAVLMLANGRVIKSKNFARSGELD
jgi:thiamine biosynthesis lipoprotein